MSSWLTTANKMEEGDRLGSVSAPAKNDIILDGVACVLNLPLILPVAELAATQIQNKHHQAASSSSSSLSSPSQRQRVARRLAVIKGLILETARGEGRRVDVGVKKEMEGKTNYKDADETSDDIERKSKSSMIDNDLARAFTGGENDEEGVLAYPLQHDRSNKMGLYLEAFALRFSEDIEEMGDIIVGAVKTAVVNSRLRLG